MPVPSRTGTGYTRLRNNDLVISPAFAVTMHGTKKKEPTEQHWYGKQELSPMVNISSIALKAVNRKAGHQQQGQHPSGNDQLRITFMPRTGSTGVTLRALTRQALRIAWQA